MELPEDVLERFQRNRKRYREFDSVPLKFNLSEEEVARFAVNRHRFNGVEVVRSNMPDGDVNADTRAAGATSIEDQLGSEASYAGKTAFPRL